jgi:hypothetical protein
VSSPKLAANWRRTRDKMVAENRALKVFMRPE